MQRIVAGTGSQRDVAERSIAQTLAPGTVLSAVRIPELDGIRGIAIVSVLAYHVFAYSMQWQVMHGAPAWSGVAKLFQWLTGPGFLGVDIFFVLSGYLISGILLDSKGTPHFLRDFYARRVLRILPLYLVVLAVMACFYTSQERFLLLSLCFLSNFSYFFSLVPVGPLWSLAVEEHFYLIWPWVVKGISRQALLKVALFLCVIEPVIRFAGFPIWGDGYFYTWCRLDGLAWGAVIACLIRSPGTTPRMVMRLSWICLAAAAIVTLIGMPYGIMTRQTIVGVSLQYEPAQFVSMSLILSSLSMPGRGVAILLRNKALRPFGDLSCCLYLIHMLLMDAYDNLANWFGPLESRNSADSATCWSVPPW